METTTTTTVKKPRNIFEQIEMGVEVINDNIATLSEDMHELMARLDLLLEMPCMEESKEESEVAQ